MSGKSRIEELQEEVDAENAADQSKVPQAPQAVTAPAKAATARVVEDDGDEDEAPPQAASPVMVVAPDALANAIVKATELSSGRVRKIPYGQQQIRSPFNPTGNRHRALKRRVYQNGFALNVKTLHDDQIEMLNSGKIVPGRYLDKLITVRIEDEADGTSAMHLDYKNRTADQRMALGMRLGAGPTRRGFSNMLYLIIQEIEQTRAAAKARRKQEVAEALA